MAQKKSMVLAPLIEQLFKRAVYILKRLVDIVGVTMDLHLGTNKALEGLALPEGAGVCIRMTKFPFFMQRLKDFYFQYVDSAAKVCKEKCMEELYSTQIIYWDLVKYILSLLRIFTYY